MDSSPASSSNDVATEGDGGDAMMKPPFLTAAEPFLKGGGEEPNGVRGTLPSALAAAESPVTLS